ncbi:MAG: hypothetical protein U9P38_07885 [Campylobacterota bacterium]|nr:hypothetical protein [Campylobacterota bacterium]
MKHILLPILLVSFLQSSTLFSVLPYKIKLGERVPLKVEDKIVKYNYQNQIMGKFALHIDKETDVVNSISFSYDDFDIPVLLPKAWRKAGLKLCYDNSNGTPYEEVKTVLSSTNAYDIDESSDHYRKILSFKIGSDKQYELIFYSFSKKDLHGSGLAYITIRNINGVGLDEDY